MDNHAHTRIQKLKSEIQHLQDLIRGNTATANVLLNKQRLHSIKEKEDEIKELENFLDETDDSDSENAEMPWVDDLKSFQRSMFKK